MGQSISFTTQWSFFLPLVQSRSALFFVSLGRENLLESFVELIQNPVSFGDEWSQVSLAFSERWWSTTPILPPTLYACPITLQGCSFPVTASDGHTYERSAILTHMVRNGMRSPLTGANMRYELFPNLSLERTDNVSENSSESSIERLRPNTPVEDVT